MRPFFGPLVSTLWLFGCEANGSPTTQGTETESDQPIANASFNVGIESSAYGITLGRCEVQVAFYEPDEDDGLGDVEDDDDEVDNPDAQDTSEEESEFATVIPIVDTPGECEYARFNPDEELPVGAPDIRGTLTAGDEVLLTDENPITLELMEAGENGWRYAMPGCSQETFPFSRTFSVSAPGEIDEVPGFSLDNAVVVGPDFTFNGLEALNEEDQLLVPADADFEVTWTESAAAPQTADGPILPNQSFTLVSSRMSDNRLVEVLSCEPNQTGQMIVPAESLALLTQTRELGEDVYSSLQLDIEYLGDEMEAPWGELVRVRSRVSKSGRVQIQ